MMKQPGKPAAEHKMGPPYKQIIGIQLNFQWIAKGCVS